MPRNQQFEKLPPSGGLFIFRALRLPFLKCGLKYVSYFCGHGLESRPPPKAIFCSAVFLNDDYNFDIALRRFGEEMGRLSEMEEAPEHYEKPSVMRKKKKAAARKRLMKKIRKMNMA